MSWWEYLLGTDWKQSYDIDRQQKTISWIADSDRKRADKLAARLNKLEAENTELKVVCRALLQTLIERDLITKESFVRLAQQIEVENRQQNDWDDRRIFPKSESVETEIKIDFTSARQKPESLNG